MLRFAPTHTGDMHIDDLRVALFNHIVAKQKNEDLIIRIEDMDQEQNNEGKDQEILDILGLFNITHSQVLYQSKNFRFHSAMALQLLHEKKAFACFCSPEWLEQKKEEAKKAEKDYCYDDACRNLPAELVIDNTAPFTIRIARPDKPIVIKDHIQGEMSFDPDAVDSFVIMNQDKTPTYNFACAVDDMLSDISLVIRSNKYLKETPKQEYIRDALSYEKKIEYAHLPTIIDAPTVKWLLEEGYLPEAISNYLISMGINPPEEIFTLDESIEWFDLDNITKSPAPFDINKLKEINKQHLKRLDAKELSRYVGFADEEIGKLAHIYLEEAKTTKELKAKIAPIFTVKDNIANEMKESVESLRSAIKKAPYFEEYTAFKEHLLNEVKLEEKEFVKALRILLTNAEHGPDISEIYKYLKNYLGEIIK